MLQRYLSSYSIGKKKTNVVASSKFTGSAVVGHRVVLPASQCFKSWGKLTVTPQKWQGGLVVVSSQCKAKRLPIPHWLNFFYVVQSVPCPFHKSHHRWNYIEEAMTSMLLRYNSQGY